jgi:polysaccharide export outer membrane protein
MRSDLILASNRLAALALLGLSLALAACASSEVDELPPPTTPTIAEYRLVDGDRVAVTVFGHEELSAIVDIVIARYQPFYVLGEVNTPGSYDFVLGLNMRKAVAEAGGFTRRAAKSQVLLTRRTEHGQTVRDVSLDTSVYPGDVIEIKRRWF